MAGAAAQEPRPVAERRTAKAAGQGRGQDVARPARRYGKEIKDKPSAREGVRLIKRHAATLLSKPANVNLGPLEIKTALAKVIAATPKTGSRTRAALSALFEYGMAQ